MCFVDRKRNENHIILLSIINDRRKMLLTDVEHERWDYFWRSMVVATFVIAWDGRKLLANEIFTDVESMLFSTSIFSVTRTLFAKLHAKKFPSIKIFVSMGHTRIDSNHWWLKRHCMLLDMQRQILWPCHIDKAFFLHGSLGN